MPTGPEVLRARPLLSLDKVRWPWLSRPLRQGRDPYYVSQRRKKGQISIFSPSSLSLWRAIKRCVSDENLQKYTSYRKDRFAQSGVFDILMWNLIATISISSCLYLSLARPRPHMHTHPHTRTHIETHGSGVTEMKGWKRTRYSGSSLPH